EIARRARDVERARQGDRLAGVDALGPRQILGERLDPRGYRQQQAGALLGRCPRPGRERLPCRRDRALDVALVTVRDRREDLPGGRLDDVEMVARSRLDQVAVDV